MSLINKYQISEKDLYQLGLIESRKKTSGLFKKEKLKAASLKILKPYNIKFLDLGNLLNEIKIGDFDVKYSEKFSELEKQEINKFIDENSNVSNFYKDWWGGKSKKQKRVLVIGAIVLFIIIGQFSGVGKPSACDCVEQFNYWSQDGGLYKINQDLITRCTDYYKDFGADSYPDDLYSAKRNAKKKCD
jgi:hypothetical protein